MAAPATRSEIAVCSVQASIDTPILPVQAGDRQLLLIRDDDRLVACERACPHEQADLALGRCAHGRLFCPRHFASFDLTDGAVSGGWVTRRLRLYPVVVKVEEIVVVMPRAES
jgi:3-phenylpropionate/trans-cinnamate dioxygenase ferredoxin subunit